MAKFLTTNGISNQIEQIIIGAEEKLVLVSPYLQISKTFFERLKDASKKNVEITIVYGKDELKSNERKSLAELDNLELLFFENLHAKCYFNENEMVITSMNMYHFSEKTNREMGVSISKDRDDELYMSAYNETRSIIESSEVKQLSKGKNKKVSKIVSYKKIKEIKSGFCIRCKTEVPSNKEKPYCVSCFSVWAQYARQDYEEKYCHSCGKSKSTSFNRPECYTCFSKNKEKLALT